MNIGINRVQTGIHYRSDALQGLLQGEQMAISVPARNEGTVRRCFQRFRFPSFRRDCHRGLTADSRLRAGLRQMNTGGAARAACILPRAWTWR
jgi:hypothetical protein